MSSTVLYGIGANIVLDLVDEALRRRNAAALSAEEREQVSRELQDRSEATVHGAHDRFDAADGRPVNPEDDGA